MNSKRLLEDFGKNGFLVEQIRGTGQSGYWLQDTLVMGSVYGKETALRYWRSRRFLIFVAGPLNMFEVRDRSKGVSLKKHVLKTRGETY